MTSSQQLGSSVAICDFVIEEQLRKLAPKSVVDFGAGAGKNGIIVRRIVPECELVAVEGYEPAVQSLRTGGVYNKVHHALLQEWVADGSDRFSLAIFGDVIEHLTPRQIHSVLSICLKRFDHIIIVVPLHDIFQDDSYGNELEIHRAYITESFFDRYMPIEKHIVEGGYTIMNVRIDSSRERAPLVRSIPWKIFHCFMLVLQPLGLARVFVNLLKKTPIKKMPR
jgi:hypothetical protein